MVGAMPPCQKRLLLHILASSTATSSSCSAASGSLRPPQPARLHAVPAAGSRRSSAMGRRVLLRATVPDSCGQRRRRVTHRLGGGLGGEVAKPAQHPWVRGDVTEM